MVVAAARRHDAAGEVICCVEAQEAHEPAKEADVERLARSAALPPHESGRDAERAIETRDEIAHRRPGPHWRILLPTVETHEAAHRLRDEVERGAVCVRARCAKSVDTGRHDAWAQLLKALGRKAQLL